jgi:hypothetical protein
MKLTPWIGGYLTGNGLFSRLDPAGAPPLSVGGLFELYSVEPYGQLDMSVVLPGVLFLSSGMRVGRYPETFDPLRTAVYDASAELNVSLPLSFIDVYPFRDTTLRTYGKIDILADGGLAFLNGIGTAAEEITIHIVKGGNPYSLVTLIGNAIYQDSYTYEPYLYYTPISDLTLGGSLMGSTWIGVGGGSVLGVSLRGFAGAYQQQARTPSPVFYWKFEGELNLNLDQGNSSYTLSAFFNTTLPFSYWSLMVRLGYSVKTPVILAP